MNGLAEQCTNEALAEAFSEPFTDPRAPMSKNHKSTSDA